jgi:ion channel-forming bestrophin family protein
VTIPGSIIAAYIILGILLIGREIENPFGNDVNDLPLDLFCSQLAAEIDIISSKKKPKSEEWVMKSENMVLFPISSSGYQAWANRGEKRIRQELKAKTEIGYAARKEMQADLAEHVGVGDDKV